MERRLGRRKFVDEGTQQQLLFDRDEEPYQAQLERVLGLTVTSSSCLASNAATSEVAYTAGCTVVLYTPQGRRQRFLLSRDKKPLTCLAFSRDGHFLATGESGQEPKVRVWDVAKEEVVSEMREHRFGVASLAFNRDRSRLVSVGDQHDQAIVVWDWRNGKKLASGRLSLQVYGMSFSESGSYLVTAGSKHVKFWYLAQEDGSATEGGLRRRSAGKVNSLQGRTAILNAFRNNVFCAVVCGSGQSADGSASLADRCYALVQSGTLCVLDSTKRSISKWLALNSEGSREPLKANALCLAGGVLYVGMDRGVVHLFDALSLAYIARLPQPHFLGVDVASVQSVQGLQEHPAGSSYPDTLAIVHSDSGPRRLLNVVYSDHSHYVWDVQDPAQVGKAASHLYHAGLVFAVEAFPAHRNRLLPPGTFATCASDNTIRLWHVDRDVPLASDGGAMARNLYSEELVKVLYTQPEDTAALCDMDVGGEAKVAVGVRTLKFSPDGSHLASGDRSGNLRVHDVRSSECLLERESHESDILTIDFTDPEASANPDDVPKLMVTGSRDRLLHLFDASADYAHLQTMNDHSSTITAAKFVTKAQGDSSAGLRLVSGGADKSLILRSVKRNLAGEVEVRRTAQLAVQSALFDVGLEPEERLAYVACHDHHIRSFDLDAAKKKTALKGALGEGSVGKVALDPSGSYIAASCDKVVSLLSLQTGEPLAALVGHSEMVSGMAWLPDARRLVTVSGDGCVFVWRLHSDLTRKITERCQRLAIKGVWGRVPQPLCIASTVDETRGSEDEGTGSDVIDVPSSEASHASPPTPPRPDITAHELNNMRPEAEQEFLAAQTGLPTPPKEEPPPSPPSKTSTWVQRIKHSFEGPPATAPPPQVRHP